MHAVGRDDGTPAAIRGLLDLAGLQQPLEDGGGLLAVAELVLLEVQLLLVRLQIKKLLLHVFLLLLRPGLLLLDFVRGAAALRSDFEQVDADAILDYVND